MVFQQFCLPKWNIKQGKTSFHMCLSEATFRVDVQHDSAGDRQPWNQNPAVRVEMDRNMSAANVTTDGPITDVKSSAQSNVS